MVAAPQSAPCGLLIKPASRPLTHPEVNTTVVPEVFFVTGTLLSSGPVTSRLIWTFTTWRRWLVCYGSHGFAHTNPKMWQAKDSVCGVTMKHGCGPSPRADHRGQQWSSWATTATHSWPNIPSSCNLTFCPHTKTQLLTLPVDLHGMNSLLTCKPVLIYRNTNWCRSI